jgi:hypothetical protein
MAGGQRLISWLQPCSTSNVALNTCTSAHGQLMGHPNWAGCDSPRTVRPTQTVRHSSTDHLRTSCNTNPPTKWIERKARKNTRRKRRTLGQLGPRGLSTPTRRTVRHVRIDAGTTARGQSCKHPTTYPSTDLPNGLSS